MKTLIILFFFISFFFSKSIAQTKNEINIVSIIDNEIITNIDIENEINYLIAINDSLKSVKIDELKEFAHKSLQKEIIKKKELLKFFELNQENEYVDNYIKNLYENLQLNSLEEFKNYLAKYNLEYNNIKKKIEIEIVWNELIYTKYKDQLNIDLEKIKNKINKKDTKVNTYQLSEILFQIKNKEDLNIQYTEIIKSINEKGFINTANIYSLSESAQKGGEIGWINDRQLSDSIKNKINFLEIGEISKPIIVPGGFLILKINDKKKENVKIDEKEELNKIVTYEKNKQFNQFSLIFYNKLKINSKINEK